MAPAGSPGQSKSRMRAPTLVGVATVRGAQRAPGPTHTRARGTKNEPTSGPAPMSTIDRFHPARVRLRPVGNSYQPARRLTHSGPLLVLQPGLMSSGSAGPV